ncbi:hypothetical protein FACS189437_01280 [Bacteroidia bacterium]|nr:hypothetical protein FACS189437_01280 [Bacteroidia bacterium]
MKIRPDGAVCFYQSKLGPAILMLTGAVMGLLVLMCGFSFTLKFILPLAISALMFGSGIYLLFDKRPYVTITKNAIEILHLPPIAKNNIQRITAETFIEKRINSKGRKSSVLKEYIAIYVNDLSVFSGSRLNIEPNTPATPFHILVDSFSKKEAGLLKETVKNIFGYKADLRIKMPPPTTL